MVVSKKEYQYYIGFSFVDKIKGFTLSSITVILDHKIENMNDIFDIENYIREIKNVKEDSGIVLLSVQRFPV